jgi:urea transport system permease protein
MMRWLALLVAGLLLAAGVGAQAQTRNQVLDAAIGQFAADSFADTEQAIVNVAAAGAPHAAAILEALADRRLFVHAERKEGHYKDAAGALFDLRGGRPRAAEPDGATMVRLNNRLRNIVQAALGSLTLLAPDPARRAQAADSVYRSRDSAALPLVEDALAKEVDPRVKAALEKARAAILLVAPEAPEAARVDDRKARKREEAAARQRLSDVRKPLLARQAALEREMESLTAQKEAIDAWLASEAAYAEDTRDALKERIARQGELTWQLARLEAEWLENEEALERTTK